MVMVRVMVRVRVRARARVRVRGSHLGGGARRQQMIYISPIPPLHLR